MQRKIHVDNSVFKVECHYPIITITKLMAKFIGQRKPVLYKGQEYLLSSL